MEKSAPYCKTVIIELIKARPVQRQRDYIVLYNNTGTWEATLKVTFWFLVCCVTLWANPGISTSGLKIDPYLSIPDGGFISIHWLHNRAEWYIVPNLRGKKLSINNCIEKLYCLLTKLSMQRDMIKSAFINSKVVEKLGERFWQVF